MNVHLSIRDNLDVDLKIRDETTVHSWKQIWPKNETDERIKISTKAAPENAPFVIRNNFDRYVSSKAIFNRKEFCTDAGIIVDFNRSLSQILSGALYLVREGSDILLRVKSHM
jgi:hypothetical protein